MTTRMASSRNSPTRNPMSSRPSAESRAMLTWHRTCLRWRCHARVKQMPAPLRIDGWKRILLHKFFEWFELFLGNGSGSIHGSDPVRPASSTDIPSCCLDEEMAADPSSPRFPANHRVPSWCCRICRGLASQCWPASVRPRRMGRWWCLSLTTRSEEAWPGDLLGCLGRPVPSYFLR